jgi:hypothetical protein
MLKVSDWKPNHLKVFGSKRSKEHTQQKQSNTSPNKQITIFKVETKNMAKFEHVFVSVWSVNQVRSIYHHVMVLIS